MTTLDDTLVDRFRRAADDLHIDTVPVADVHHRRRVRRRHRMMVRGGGILATLTIAIAGLVAVASRPTDSPEEPTGTGGGMSIEVGYERVTYRQEADLTCPGPELDHTGTFDEFTIETWSDRAGKRWRTTVTYPDGSTRSLIAFGGYWFEQTDLFVQGEAKGARLGCVNTIDPAGDPTAFELTHGAPGNSDMLFSLNPPRENPALPDPASSDPEQQYPPLALGDDGSSLEDFRVFSVLMPGTHVDSQGRAAQLWRDDRCCSTYGPEYGNRTVSQSEDVFVDPTTGQLMEWVANHSITGIGSLRATLTLVSSTTQQVDVDFFDQAGFTRIPAFGERDDGPGSTELVPPPGTEPGTVP